MTSNATGTAPARAFVMFLRNPITANLPGDRFVPPPGGYQHDDPNRSQATAVNRPLDLPRHETARQYVDALQEPDGPEEHKKHTHDVQRNFHLPTRCFTSTL